MFFIIYIYIKKIHNVLRKRVTMCNKYFDNKETVLYSKLRNIPLTLGDTEFGSEVRPKICS